LLDISSIAILYSPMLFPNSIQWFEIDREGNISFTHWV